MQCQAAFGWLPLLIVFALSVSAGAVETVRVDASSGAPRLVVDGKPVRARMFWGAPAARPLPIGTEWREVAFEFTPAEDEPARATMHFRFGSTPGDVFLDDIRVRDLDASADVVQSDFEQGETSFTQRWTIWPTGPQNTVGTVKVEAGAGRNASAGLHVTLRRPATGDWPDFHIYHQPNLALRRGHRYQMSLWAKAQPARKLTIAFYRPGASYVFLGGPQGPFTEQIRLAAAAGVNFVSFPVHLPWPKPGEKPDFSGSDAQCQEVLDANPNALLLPRIDMGPPDWWRKAHAEAMMVWDRTPPQNPNAVVAAPEYRRDAALHLAALVEHLEAKFGRHTAGYHPCGQNTGEWFYQDTWGDPLNGYAPADAAAFRKWLSARYASDDLLRQAWGNKQVALATAEPPSPAARRAAPAGALRDPVAERPVLDFAQFQQDAMADCVLDLARAVRRASAGRKLVVFFYGYVFEFAAVRNGPATSGHYALRRVLDSPEIDVLCSPISYFDRGLGQSGPAMTAAESVALAGKMWLYEDDTSTYLSSEPFPGHTERVDTLEKTNAMLVRNTSQCALRNFGTWWMDLGSSGWFNDAGMWAEMKRLAPLDEALLAQPRPFGPEVAAVIDEQSMIAVAHGGQLVTVPGVYEARRALGRMGTPYGQYLLDDVAAGRAPARMVVLLTAWKLSAERRKQLIEATRGRLKVWCYAPGYQSETGTSLAAMEELTGFRHRFVSPPTAWAEPTETGRRLGLAHGFGVKQPVRPLFSVEAKPDEILATYSDGSPAVAMRQTANGPSLFVGPPGLTSDLLRLAARRAGVHLFTSSDCNVVANGPYLLLHGAEDGTLELDTGRKSPVLDLLVGQSVGEGPKLRLPMRHGQTRLLRIAHVNP